MTPEALQARIQAGEAPAILDVREPDEFAAGHVPGAVNVPFWRFVIGWPAVPAGRRETLVIYCGMGPRARIARSALRLRGYRALEELDGHMTAWRARALPEAR